MADKILMVDTSLLLNHFRKTKREKSQLYQRIEQYDFIFISAVTEYEVLAGATAAQATFWAALLAEFQILPFDSSIVQTIIQVNHNLNRKRKSIDTADLFIAATAVAHNLAFDTLNRKHFEHIYNLNLLPNQDGGGYTNTTTHKT